MLTVEEIETFVTDIEAEKVQANRKEYVPSILTL